MFLVTDDPWPLGDMSTDDLLERYELFDDEMSYRELSFRYNARMLFQRQVARLLEVNNAKSPPRVL